MGKRGKKCKHCRILHSRNSSSEFSGNEHSHWPLQVVITQESGGDERRKYLLILEKYVKSYQIIWQALEWVNNGTNGNYIWKIEQESIKYYNSRKSWWPQQQQQQDWWKYI